MMVLIGFLLFFVLIGAAGALGVGTDSRDPEFGLGAVTRRPSDGQPTAPTGKVCEPEPRTIAPGEPRWDAPVAQPDRATAF